MQWYFKQTYYKKNILTWNPWKMSIRVSLLEFFIQIANILSLFNSHWNWLWNLQGHSLLIFTWFCHCAMSLMDHVISSCDLRCTAHVLGAIITLVFPEASYNFWTSLYSAASPSERAVVGCFCCMQLLATDSNSLQ